MENNNDKVDYSPLEDGAYNERNQSEASMDCEDFRPADYFPDAEAEVLLQRLNAGDGNAVPGVQEFVEKCSSENVDMAYSLIEATHNHAQRLKKKHQKCKEQMRRANMKYKKSMQYDRNCFDVIQKALNAVCVDNVLSNFSASQREDILISSAKTLAQMDAHVKKCVDLNIDVLNVPQVRAPPNISSELDDLNIRLDELIQRKNAFLCEMAQLEQRRRDAGQEELGFLTSTVNEQELARKHVKQAKSAGGNHSTSLKDDSNRAIGLISIFLMGDADGRKLEEIFKVLQLMDSTIQMEDALAIMNQFPSVFQEVGDCTQTKWRLLEY